MESKNVHATKSEFLETRDIRNTMTPPELSKDWRLLKKDYKLLHVIG